MLLVQDYLKNKSLVRLEQAHGITSYISGHKVSLNYSTTKTLDNDLLAQQCRGLILCVKDTEAQIITTNKSIGNTTILARPFDRFFDFGNNNAPEIDFLSPQTIFYEKMDGIMCIVYYDSHLNEWFVATRSTPEACSFIGENKEYTFRTLFEKAVQDTVGKNFETWASNMLFRDTTYMFELTTPKNQVTVKYNDYKITLLGARKTCTGKELFPSFLQAQIKVPAPERFKCISVEQILNFATNRDPSKYKGIVAVDQDFRRIKIKNRK